MGSDLIFARVVEAWQDTSQGWRDEYATRYKTAVIQELESALKTIQNLTTEINEASDTALSSLRKYVDSERETK